MSKVSKIHLNSVKCLPKEAYGGLDDIVKVKQYSFGVYQCGFTQFKFAGLVSLKSQKKGKNDKY